MKFLALLLPAVALGAVVPRSDDFFASTEAPARSVEPHPAGRA